MTKNPGEKYRSCKVSSSQKWAKKMEKKDRNNFLNGKINTLRGRRTLNHVTSWQKTCTPKPYHWPFFPFDLNTQFFSDRPLKLQGTYFVGQIHENRDSMFDNFDPNCYQEHTQWEKGFFLHRCVYVCVFVWTYTSVLKQLIQNHDLKVISTDLSSGLCSVLTRGITHP